MSMIVPSMRRVLWAKNYISWNDQETSIKAVGKQAYMCNKKFGTFFMCRVKIHWAEALICARVQASAA
jgi:hypothetical protein